MTSRFQQEALESAEMMEKLADSVIDSATEEMMDISLADMKEMPMLEKAIEMMDEKGISIDEINCIVTTVDK